MPPPPLASPLDPLFYLLLIHPGVFQELTYIQTSPTITAPTPTKHSFERRVEDIKPSKTDINFVIMDYLINEGYPSAAKKFAMEANLKPAEDFGSIQERVEIRNAIHAGDIQAAIERVNELNPQILDLDAGLHFSLLRLQLIELIRACISKPNGDITPALNFASTQLAPRASTGGPFLEDLERTMALLIFPPEKLTQQLAELLNPNLRRDVANRVNEAILASQGEPRESRIRNFVRLRTWAEERARETKKAIPTHINLGLDDSSKDGDDEVMNGSGDVDMGP